MALVAEDLRLLVTHVAKRAFQVLMIVRGVVRIRRLDVLRLLGELLRIVALDSLIHVRGLDLLIGAVAGFALHAGSNMLVSGEVGGVGARKRERAKHQSQSA